MLDGIKRLRALYWFKKTRPEEMMLTLIEENHLDLLQAEMASEHWNATVSMLRMRQTRLDQRLYELRNKPERIIRSQHKGFEVRKTPRETETSLPDLHD